MACLKCGKSFARETTNRRICAKCTRENESIRESRILTCYNGPAHDIIDLRLDHRHMPKYDTALI